MTFEPLKLIPPLLRAVREQGYTNPTSIQTQAIPLVLEGKDVLGCARTGTGKTAAFALPILQRLCATPAAKHGPRPVRVLVLCPTRELATQIGESFATYGKYTAITHAVVFGGVGYPRQREALRSGVDVLVATPGRLLDLIGDRTARFDALEVLVLDEADRMLDMGFLPDVRRILSALPKRRQTLCFSATMPPPIQKLVQTILHQPVQVSAAPVSSTAIGIEQAVFFVEKSDKHALLAHLLQDRAITRALVFTRTKHGADRVVRQLSRAGLRADAIHGNKSQNARERALSVFKRGSTRILVATDIAARGIDVDDISHVINFDLPNISESYVHRIGRTARAEASGIAYSFCDREERAYLGDIERLIRHKIRVVAEHPFVAQKPRTHSGRSDAGSHAVRHAHTGPAAMRPAIASRPVAALAAHAASAPEARRSARGSRERRPDHPSRTSAGARPAPAAHAPRAARPPHRSEHAPQRPSAAHRPGHSSGGGRRDSVRARSGRNRR